MYDILLLKDWYKHVLRKTHLIQQTLLKKKYHLYCYLRCIFPIKRSFIQLQLTCFLSVAKVQHFLNRISSREIELNLISMDHVRRCQICKFEARFLQRCQWLEVWKNLKTQATLYLNKYKMQRQTLFDNKCFVIQDVFHYTQEIFECLHKWYWRSVEILSV